MSQFDQKIRGMVKAYYMLQRTITEGESYFPVVGNSHNLYPHWEVRYFNNDYRHLDLAYTSGGAKGGIEIQGYGLHTRDLNVTRFKD